MPCISMLIFINRKVKRLQYRWTTQYLRGSLQLLNQAHRLTSNVTIIIITTSYLPCFGDIITSKTSISTSMPEGAKNWRCDPHQLLSNIPCVLHPLHFSPTKLSTSCFSSFSNFILLYSNFQNFPLRTKFMLIVEIDGY